MSVLGTAWSNYKAKDLLGIPWAVAFALRANGWYLRSEIILAKKNPMPESVRDRPTRAHEQFFLLSKRPTYFYDSDAIREPLGANKRSVWWVSTESFSGAHFATFGTKWIEPCILAGAPERACGECGAPWVRVVERQNESTYAQIKREHGITYHDMKAEAEANGITPGNVGGTHRPGRRGETFASPQNVTTGFEPSCSHDDSSARGVVLDPFAGAGTTGLVALQHGRDFVGIELSPEYARMARERIETAVRLGFRAPSSGPEQIPGQVSIFDPPEPVADDEALYVCEDCDITRKIGELTSGCPICGETMVPA